MSFDRAEPAMPVALTIAGSDSGGGAGIQADLQAFAAFGCFGTCAITAVTAQNPAGVSDVAAVPPASVSRQIEAVTAAFSVGAIKTGMLFDTAIIAAVCASLDQVGNLPLVVDPVMVATSGARLLREEACTVLRDELLPRAAVVTPNLPEAEILVSRHLRSRAEICAAARELATRSQAMVVIKGGHDHGSRCVDVVSDGDRAWTVSSERVAAATTHGTGCRLSAAVAACLARGYEPLAAVVQARAYVLGALRHCRLVGPETWAMTTADDLPLADVAVHDTTA